MYISKEHAWGYDRAPMFLITLSCCRLVLILDLFHGRHFELCSYISFTANKTASHWTSKNNVNRECMPELMFPMNYIIVYGNSKYLQDGRVMWPYICDRNSTGVFIHINNVLIH